MERTSDDILHWQMQEKKSRVPNEENDRKHKNELEHKQCVSKLSYPMHPDHNKSTKGDRPSQSSRARRHRSGLHGQLCQAQVVVAQLTQTRTPEAKANKTKQDSRWSSQSPTGPDDRSESLNTDLIFLKLLCLVFFKFYCS